MYFSIPVAIILTLLSAAMWGSWMQVIKLRKGYPIEGIAFWLFMFSFVLIWGATLILSPKLLPEGIIVASRGYTTVIIEIMLGGAMMSCGVLFGLVGMGELGLLLVTTLSGTLTSILGVVTSIAKEGLPYNPTALPLILIATAALLLASFICSCSSNMCARDRMIAEGKVPDGEKLKSAITPRLMLFILLYAVLSNGWSIGTATGIAVGMPPILICTYMATGSALGIFFVCSVLFTYKKMWKTVLCVRTSKRPLLLGMVSALGYYGGNLISIYSMPALSATLSFLFGRTYSVWTYFWSFYYKEYQGASKKTIFVLSSGLLLYVLALGLLLMYNSGNTT